jgi:hypothetical protein
MANQTSKPRPEQLNDPARDDLRGTLANTICNASLYAKRAQPYLLGSDMSEVLDRTADAILAAGYRKPRTIDAATELDALPFESVITDAYGTPHVCERHRTDGTHNEWRMSGHNHLIDSEDVLMHGPATVVHAPEAAK